MTDDEKTILLKKLANKLEKESVIHLQEQTDRTQLKNKELLKEKFYKLILVGLKVIKPRKPTKVSKSVKIKRKENKVADSKKKVLRRKII